MSQDLNLFNKTNVIIWVSILIGMVVLSIVVFVLDQGNTFTPIPQAQGVNQLLFVLAVVFAFGILMLKRTAFLPQKIVTRVVHRSGEDKNNAILNLIRRNYIIVWVLAELICIMGFINYIFAVNFQSYLVFAIVAIYSVLINYPRQYLAEICIERLTEYNE